MWWVPLAAAGAAMAGDLIGGHQDKIQAQKNRDLQYDQMDRQEKLQREFAQHGIRWKVQDAKAAGIHPVYALGANTASYTPMSVGGDSGYREGDAFRSMGQNLSRAISATSTSFEKESQAMQLKIQQADYEGKVIDNQIRAKQLNDLSVNKPSLPVGDGLAATNFMPGQGNSGTLVKVKPKERSASQPGRPAQEAGWVPDAAYSRTDTGFAPVVPESLSESLEDDIIGKLQWRIRNQLMPNLTGSGKPALSQLPKWADDWSFDFKSQEWRPVKGKGSYPLRDLENWFGKWRASRSAR